MAGIDGLTDQSIRMGRQVGKRETLRIGGQERAALWLPRPRTLFSDPAAKTFGPLVGTWTATYSKQRRQVPMYAKTAKTSRRRLSQ